MEDSNRHIDEVFRERLSDLNVTPPADVWNSVKAALPRRKKVGYITVFRLIAATLLLFVLTGSLWLIYLKKPSDGDLADRPVSSVNPLSHTPAADGTTELSTPEGVAATESASPEKTSPASSGGAVATAAGPGSLTVSPGTVADVTAVQHHESLPGAEMIRSLPAASGSTYALAEVRTSRAGGIGYSATPLSTSTKQLSLWPVSSTLTPRKEPTYAVGIGGDFGPVFSYRHLPYKTEYTHYLNGQEEGALSYGGNFSVFIRRKKRLSIQSGIGYFRTGQVSTDMVAFRQIKSGNLAILESKGNNYLYNSGGEPGYENVPLFIANRMDPSGNNQTEYILTYLGHGLYEPVDARLKLDYEFLEVPLVFRYRLVDKVFGVNVMGGMGASLLFNSSASVITADGEITTLGKIDNLRQTNFNSILGVGFSYRFTQDFLFRIEPTFKYYINPVSETGGIESHPFLFGIYSGLSVYF